MILVAMGRPVAPSPPPPSALAGAAAARPPERELDRATLARCKARDPMAFRAFVVRYERPVFALLSRLLGRGPHVEDLAQEAFLRAFAALPGFDLDREGRPSTWLLTIATRLALDARRRQAFAPALLGDDEGVGLAGALAAPSDPEADHARRELGRAIERAATELSHDQRAVFVLAEFHDLSHAEIARAVGAPEATVKTRLFRAREHMRARLRDAKEEHHGGR